MAGMAQDELEQQVAEAESAPEVAAERPMSTILMVVLVGLLALCIIGVLVAWAGR